MSRTISTTTTQGGLSVQAYVGDANVLLAIDLDQHLTANLAGFAIQRTDPAGKPTYLMNRINFGSNLTKTANAKTVVAEWTPSNLAPFQKFRWIDFPSDSAVGSYRYDVTAMYFADPKDATKLKTAVSTSVTANLSSRSSTNFHVGFTRGYMSSQAYADKFHNAPFRPDDRKDYLFDTTPYEAQYLWLGFHARKMVFEFLQSALADMASKRVSLDVCVYDIDEPDFVRLLGKFGKNLRIIIDDYPKAPPDRNNAAAYLKKTGAQIVRTHFQRFAHDKLIIRKDGNKPTSVITGSANYSIRGLYVQANSVIQVDDPNVAAAYEAMFQSSFTDPGKFASSPPAKKWFAFAQPGLPKFQVSFAPHADATLSLGPVAADIERAQRNVVFAIMEEGQAQGPVFPAIADVVKKDKVFTFGTFQMGSDAVKLINAGGANDGEIANFAFLNKFVPEPFKAEVSGSQTAASAGGAAAGGKGGAFTGMVIHHKFVVVDFNSDNPVVYCGSSNLAQGGEQSNGDNLLQISDRAIATMYAIEGIRLADHYHFRMKLQAATAAQPVALQGPGAKAPWWSDYYKAGTAHYRERTTLMS
jgi:hypothetical protein